MKNLPGKQTPENTPKDCTQKDVKEWRTRLSLPIIISEGACGYQVRWVAEQAANARPFTPLEPRFKWDSFLSKSDCMLDNCVSVDALHIAFT